MEIKITSHFLRSFRASTHIVQIRYVEVVLGVGIGHANVVDCEQQQQKLFTTI